MFHRFLMIILLLCFALGGYVAYTAVKLPNVKRALEAGVEPSQTSQILASDKTVIMSYGKFHYKPVPINRMSPHLINALIATEDRRFQAHQGIDLFGIARAMVQNVKHKGIREGGSTLTQQLARNVFLSNERSIQRKVKEALLAIKIEQQLTKEQILELYLNNIYFGEGAYGVGAASQVYFNKLPSELTLEEAALLAGLPQAPSRYNPFANPKLAVKRRNEVLANLVEFRKLTKEELPKLQGKPLSLNPKGRSVSSSDKAPYFNRYVIEHVLDDLGLEEQAFWQQGLKIHTTLDLRAQMIAENQLIKLSESYGRKQVNQQAALLSIDNNGRFIAYVGGKNFSQTQFDRVSSAKRQAGSLFKLFVYTTAIENGFSPLTVYKDAPVMYEDYDNWEPKNYDKAHHGYMSIAQALAKSNNVISSKVTHDVGPASVMDTAHKMGITSPLHPHMSISLGAEDVTLKEMTTAFSVLANDGYLIEPYAIEKIVDKRGHLLFQHKPNKQAVLRRGTRDTMVQLLQGVVRFGTGRGAALEHQMAGKTGTSDDYRDAWFIGFTPSVTTGIWVGNDDNTSTGGVTGGSLPAVIWKSYMKKLLEGMPEEAFDLAFALPVQEKDYFVFNLEYLSDSEPPPEEGDIVPVNAEAYNHDQYGQAQNGVAPLPNYNDEGDNNNVYSFTDGGTYQRPPNESVHFPTQRRQRTPNQGHYHQNQSPRVQQQPIPQQPPPNTQHVYQYRPSRPIVDPVYPPRVQPQRPPNPYQQPQGNGTTAPIPANN